MGFEGFFSKVGFGRKGLGTSDSESGSALHPTIVAELSRLDLYRRGLGTEAVRYVATGEGAGVIRVIEDFQKTMPVHSAPYHKDITPRVDTTNATNSAMVRGEIAPGPAIKRLMEIRVAVQLYTPPYYDPQPAEKLPLLAFQSLLGSGLIDNRDKNYRPVWNALIKLPQVFEHFKQFGANVANLFEYVLAREDIYVIDPESWSSGEDCGRYALTYPSAFATVLLGLETNRRPGAVKVALHYTAYSQPEVESAFIKMLTKPFGKADRELAMSALARIEPDQLLALLNRDYAGVDSDTRFGLVQAAGRNGAEAVLTFLREREPTEKAAKAKAAIQGFLETIPSGQPAEEEHAEPGYQAIDGSYVALPARKDLGSDVAPPASAEEREQFSAIVKSIQLERAQKCAQEKPDSYRRRELQPLIEAEIEAMYGLMTQGTPVPINSSFNAAHHIKLNQDAQVWHDKILDRLPLKVSLRAMPVNHNLVFEAVVRTYKSRILEKLASERISRLLEADLIDLRDIGESKQLRPLLSSSSYGNNDDLELLAQLPRNTVWPLLAESSDIFDEAFGLKPANGNTSLPKAMAALALLPKIPQRYLPKLLDIAVSEKRPLRRQAMALLKDAKDLVQRVEALLDDARQAVRVNAATWLADMRSTASETALRKRLKKEKSDPVRTALIEALQRLGADLSDVISPTILIAEAEAAAAKAPPALPQWLVRSGLPAVHFMDGSTVPQAVISHWLALAIKLKDPSACGQFGIYLDQLNPASKQRFSNWVLESWISYDTTAGTLEDATAYALANYQDDWRWYVSSSARTAELKDKIVAEIAREKVGELVNSGSDTKGMLALASRAEPVWAASRVRWFLKKHGRRSNQAMALLEVLAGIGEPAALQVVIAASVRLKQKSTQARAAEIAERYAEDRGWSIDELADRTVPTAGFDDDGILELPCGEDQKLYTARLDATLTIHLFNPEEKAIKSLPAGDDEATKESKKAFSAAKKELAQVIELQGSRLFEAMCVERTWPVADWQIAFHDHPVMRRLIERLVWQGLTEDDQPLNLFRPTQEGDFTDANDNPVDLDRFAKVRLAHGTLVDAAQCALWLQHLKDYEISPFIAQFDTVRTPLTLEHGEADAIFDRQGWKADSRTFRGLSEKRGYERIMRDGGGCEEYVKTFPSHGITATIFHTGSHAIDENNPVALKELRFAKQKHRGSFKLKDVPPVMLAECWADYHAIAAKGVFDPEWEEICPW